MGAARVRARSPVRISSQCRTPAAAALETKTHALDPPSFEELRRRYSFSDDDDEPPTVVPFATVATARSDPGRILEYLHQLGCSVGSLGELHSTICALDDEELGSFIVEDGSIAVTVASDGTWFLFKP